MPPITPNGEINGTLRPKPIEPPALKHTPILRLHLNELTHPATTAFLTTIDTSHLMPNAIKQILRHLYHPHGANHIPHVRSVTLILRPMGGVAYTTGLDLDSAHKEIHVSLEYLSRNLSAPLAFRDEANGVITHEMVHCFQHDCKGTAPGGLVEGIADYVRLKAGLAPPHWKKGATGKERGEKWDEGYQKTAWFLEWLEERNGLGSVSRVNATMGKGEYKEKEFWEGLFGASVHDLWKEYQKSWGKDCVEDRQQQQQQQEEGEHESTVGGHSGADTEPELVDLSIEEREEADGATGQRS